jgi:hypothetical protein
VPHPCGLCKGGVRMVFGGSANAPPFETAEGWGTRQLRTQSVSRARQSTTSEVIVSRLFTRIGLAVAATVAGGLSFWLPITAVEVARGRELSVAVSLILPFVSLLVTYVVVARRWEKKAPSLPLWMCFGIYVLGPVMMDIGYSALQGGLTRFSGWQDVKFLAFLSVPPLALMFAGVVAIPMVLSTAVLLWAHFKARKRNVSALDAPGTGADLP